MSAWEGLNPPYSTIVADPPWHYDGFPPSHWPGKRMDAKAEMPYSGMSLDEIKALPVKDLAASDACLFLWTTNRYLRDAFDVVKAWGFRPTQTMVWCKPPKGQLGGAAFAIATEFIILGRRGHAGTGERQDRNWWEWPRTPHSVKPAAFGDLVEKVSPGPYVELFARQPRLGWDHWGHGYEMGGAA